MMRVVYFGKTAAGKTRVCEKLNEDYTKQGLEVISNIPDITDEQTLNYVDSNKLHALLEYRAMFRDVYNNIISDKYHECDKPFIMKYLRYLISEGDVLILDDLDSQLPRYVLNEIIEVLKEDNELDPLWKHVIITGYDWRLVYLMEDINKSPIYFVTDNTKVKSVIGYSNIEEEYYNVLF